MVKKCIPRQTILIKKKVIPVNLLESVTQVIANQLKSFFKSIVFRKKSTYYWQSKSELMLSLQIHSSVNSFWGVPCMWVKSFPAFWQPFILDRWLRFHGKGPLTTLWHSDNRHLFCNKKHIHTFLQLEFEFCHS